MSYYARVLVARIETVMLLEQVNPVACWTFAYASPEVSTIDLASLYIYAWDGKAMEGGVPLTGFPPDLARQILFDRIDDLVRVLFTNKHLSITRHDVQNVIDEIGNTYGQNTIAEAQRVFDSGSGVGASPPRRKSSRLHRHHRRRP